MVRKGFRKALKFVVVSYRKDRVGTGGQKGSADLDPTLSDKSLSTVRVTRTYFYLFMAGVHRPELYKTRGGKRLGLSARKGYIPIAGGTLPPHVPPPSLGPVPDGSSERSGVLAEESSYRGRDRDFGCSRRKRTVHESCLPLVRPSYNLLSTQRYRWTVGSGVWYVWEYEPRRP